MAGPLLHAGGDDVNLLVLDFETYFDQDYTLRKLTTESYIRDERFEALGCGFIADGRREWVNGPFIKEALEDYHVAGNACLCHHAQFDGLILSHHFGVRPRHWYCTLSMARLCLGVHLSVGLDSLAKYFGLAAKTVPYNEFKGLRYSELACRRDLLRRLGDGCLHDCELTLTIFQKLMSGDY